MASITRFFHVALICLCLCAGCDEDWKKQAQKSYLGARERHETGAYKESLELYLKALQYDPYHPSANLHLAELLEMHYLNIPEALYYYERYLNLPNHDKIIRKRVELAVEMLKNIDAGKIENPADMARDLIWAIGNDSQRVFIERLHSKLLQALYKMNKRPNHYFEIWKNRLKNNGDVVFCNVFSAKGNRMAEVWVNYKDENDVLKSQILTLQLEGTLWVLLSDQKRTIKNS
jgi:tetratricopeptide (TPR) repeat protein